ncbi:hypothetical protein J4717_12840 [Phaeobacter sp. HS012]|uniref:DUF6173 family protein n=1 Tax=Phaeobacter TaxID=302485 RepID=UPI000C9BC33C|nr:MULTISPECIES: DUF6173 family protein [Phaeobacter]AUQ57219.1 hypothetical protein PhaeoP30_00271 [Phaeobacter inhibens]AUQ67782.1 hypothetical protein PhaeoP78_02949 [Phaeobacter inhibens]MBQ4808358.1 hypothetical protein [Phaeobacter sp. HS012]MBQ4883424.1 hypothetical protein [Phaeobacter sp. HS011]
MTDEIATSAEAVEAAILPCVHEVHSDPDACSGIKKLPEPLQKPVADKSAARWAYERLILYIKNFEEQLDGEHEVAMGFAGGDAGVMRIEGMGYFDPDMITYYGSDSSGARTQLVQHVSQLNVMLRALPKRNEAAPANRIGFRLVSDLEGDGSDT